MATTPKAKKAPAAKPAKKRHTFSLDTPEAQEVFVAGTFNNWNPEGHPLKKDKKGVWKVALSLPAGTHEYRFVVNGEWLEDPACEERCLNAFGTHNSVLTL
ncbi:MAG: isoamylase early set domain-containing protein [Candidatus Latescibacteria bacterium]|nr:isoamylase early set domain-containing protein [Candidatus Latescibacterota bacterium]